MIELGSNKAVVYKRCPIADCRQRVTLPEYESHMYGHYNYCEHGHYEEFDLDDRNWPNCKNEEQGND